MDTFDFPVAAQLLLTPAPHPHKKQWDSLGCHTAVPFGISNHNATEWSWELTNQTDYTEVWRNEIHIVLESYRSVQVTIDSRTGRANVVRL